MLKIGVTLEKIHTNNNRWVYNNGYRVELQSRGYLIFHDRKSKVTVL